MKQAIGRLEHALSRIEQAADARSTQGGPLQNPEKAAQALKALDALIGELKGASHG